MSTLTAARALPLAVPAPASTVDPTPIAPVAACTARAGDDTAVVFGEAVIGVGTTLALFALVIAWLVAG